MTHRRSAAAHRHVVLLGGDGNAPAELWDTGRGDARVLPSMAMRRSRGSKPALTKTKSQATGAGP